jgi:hypothetical protein
MAYDKVVDSSALDADLTAVANAIREKAESTGSISFPAGFVEAIANIAAGGGLPNGISAMTSGEYVNTNDNSNIIMANHGLGVVPTFVVVIRADALPTKTNSFYMGVYLKKPVAGKNLTMCEVFTNTSNALSAYASVASMNAEAFAANVTGGTVKAGTYFWVAAVIDSVV